MARHRCMTRSRAGVLPWCGYRVAREPWPRAALAVSAVIAALITGTIFREVTQRTAKTGRPFVTATLGVKDGEASAFVKVTAFSDTAQSELLRLSEGDALSVQGALKIETYLATSGATKVSLSIVAEQILTL
jgi:Single-strand binding protein family